MYCVYTDIINREGNKMITNLRQTNEYLKERVNNNLSIIRDNEKVIRDIIKEPFTKSREERLNKVKETNKKLLAENRDAIRLQLQIVQYLYDHRFTLKKINILAGNDKDESNNIQPQENAKKLKEEDVFSMTINNKVAFNEAHPYYHDKRFINKLIKHYIQTEEYEKCTWLTQIKDSIS